MNLSDEEISKVVLQLLQNKNFINGLSKSCAYFLREDRIFDATKREVLAKAREDIQKELDKKVEEIKEYVSCKIENWTHDYLLKDFDNKLADASNGIVANSTREEFGKMIAEQVVKNLELPRIVIDLSKNYAYVDYEDE